MSGVARLATLRLLTKRVVDQHERGHRFNHRNGSRQDAGIVASAPFEGGVLQFAIHSLLLHHHCCDWFERDPEVNRLAIGNPALDSARTVARRAHFSINVSIGVVVLCAGQENSTEARSNFESFRSRKA